jgi:hypothetical protein
MGSRQSLWGWWAPFFCGSDPLSLFSSCLVAWPDKLTCELFAGRDASDRVRGIGHRSCIRTFRPRSRGIILFHSPSWINPDSWVYFGALLPMTIESTLLPICVSESSFASPSSSHHTLIEQSFYSAHQNQKYRVVVEPQLPRVADDLDDFGERGRGDIANIPFLRVDVVTSIV